MTDTPFHIPPAEPGGRICVVGAGYMGSAAAALYALHGYDVVITDRDPSVLAGHRKHVGPILESALGEKADADRVFERISARSDLEGAAEGAFLVHEIIHEVLDSKQELLQRLDGICPDGVVLATNTSSLMLSDIAARMRNRERLLGIHFMTPAHIVRAVEIIHAEFTPPELVEWGRRFAESLDHVGVACPERPGFLVNRLQFAMLLEIYRLLDEGLASRDDIDAAIRLSLGPRLALWGPLLTEDLIVSKQTALAVAESLHRQTGDKHFDPPQVLRDLVGAGKLGLVSGEGWYRFTGDYQATVAERDRQLSDILEWLRSSDPVGRIGAE